MALKSVTWSLTIMEITDENIKEIRESGCDQVLECTLIRELLESDNEYDF